MGNHCLPNTITGPFGAMCPAVCPATCNWETEMTCPGGVDHAGCPMPDTCFPNVGPVGTDGNSCPASCPATCNWNEEIMCPTGLDPNGCPMPDTCIPNTFLGSNGFK